MAEREMCPKCFLWLDNPLHDPCPETDEGRSLDDAIQAARFERDVEAGLHDDDGGQEEWKT